MPVTESCANFRVSPVEFKEGLPYHGGEANTLPDHWGAVRAFDPSTGNELWEWKNDKPMVASVLATGEDLVFAGEPTGDFNAYHGRPASCCGSIRREAVTTAARRPTA